MFTALVVVAAIAWIVRRRGSFADDDSGATTGRASLPDLSLFSVTFKDGAVEGSRGRIPRHAYNAFLEIAARGAVTGIVSVRADRQVAFGGEIPEGVRQQFRNAWHASLGH